MKNQDILIYPICMSKTQKSLSDNPTLLGRPTDFEVTINEVRLSAQSRILSCNGWRNNRYARASKKPAAEGIDVDSNGKISGLFQEVSMKLKVLDGEYSIVKLNNNFKNRDFVINLQYYEGGFFQ